MTHTMRLGTASWQEGPVERRAMVAPLASDPSRIVDLNRVERIRLEKQGEGFPDSLADALVPASLRRTLESGPRALQRVRQALAYAEKWHRRGDLPESLAPTASSVRMLPCLPRPSSLRRLDGTPLDRLVLEGPGSTLGAMPQPTLAIIGIHRCAEPAWCIALENAQGAIFGTWMVLEDPREGTCELRCGTHYRRLPLDTWTGLDLPMPRAAEAVLLPPPRVRAIPGLVPGCDFSLSAPFDDLILKLGTEIPHQTVQ